jgi:hypothetical protein
MYVGKIIESDTIEVIAGVAEIAGGLVTIKHPRCGKVEITRKQLRAGDHLVSRWVVTSCEKPDKDK